MNSKNLFINYFLFQYHFNLDNLNNVFAVNFLYLFPEPMRYCGFFLFRPALVILRKSQFFLVQKMG